MNLDDLTLAAREAPAPRRLCGFVDWVGEGRALTQTGQLRRADALALVELLETEDRVDPEHPVLSSAELAHEGWEPICLGAIQDLVQAELGPVDLDRSRVALEPVAAPTPGCPGCDGERFGFPAELAGAQEAMCAAHADRAAAIIAERLARAQNSN